MAASAPSRLAEDVSLLEDLAEAVALADDLQQVYVAALRALERATSTRRSSILLLDSHGVMRFRAWDGLSEKYRAAVEGHSPWDCGERAPREVLVPDVEADEAWAAYRSIFRAEAIRAVAFLPLQLRDHLLGKFMLYDSEPHEFGEAELRIARTIARHVAVAVGRQRSVELEHRRNEVFELLTKGRRLNDVLEALVRLIEAQSTEGVLASILLSTQGGLWRGASPSLPARYGSAVDGTPVSSRLSPAAVAAASGQRVAVPDIAEAIGWETFKPLALAHGLRSCWCDPIASSRGEVLGTLVLYYRTAQRRESHDSELADMVTRTAALAIERSRGDEERQELLEQVRTRDQRKDEFLAVLGHELRNPLSPLLNSIETLRLKGAPDETLQQTHALMERQVRQLTRLVDDLLDVSRITTGKLELQPEQCDVMTIVKRALATVDARIREKRHSLNVTGPASGSVVWADPVRLEQIVTNLLNNAAKYTEPGGRIDVVVDVATSGVTIRVRDSGVGFSAETKGRMFEPFVQGVSRSRAQGGLGVGLALARQLAAMHGGKLDGFSGGPGKGSEFVLELPKEARVPRVLGQGPESPSASESKTFNSVSCILVVDDNADAAEGLDRLLISAGYQTIVAHEGKAALEIVKQVDPDAVLLDIGMPWMVMRLRGGCGEN